MILQTLFVEQWPRRDQAAGRSPPSRSSRLVLIERCTLPRAVLGSPCLLPQRGSAFLAKPGILGKSKRGPALSKRGFHVGCLQGRIDGHEVGEANQTEAC